MGKKEAFQSYRRADKANRHHSLTHGFQKIRNAEIEQRRFGKLDNEIINEQE